MNNKAIKMWALIGVVTCTIIATWAVIELIKRVIHFGSYTIIGLFIAWMIAWMLVTAGVIVGSIGDR